MIHLPKPGHPHEYPIVKYWYTRYKGLTIEEIIKKDVDYFEWCVNTFQDVTPKQAQFYKEKTGREIPHIYIQNVEPYQWEPGDPESMYIELCGTRNLNDVILKYRGIQLDMF